MQLAKEDSLIKWTFNSWFEESSQILLNWIELKWLKPSFIRSVSRNYYFTCGIIGSLIILLSCDDITDNLCTYRLVNLFISLPFSLNENIWWYIIRGFLIYIFINKSFQQIVESVNCSDKSLNLKSKVDGVSVHVVQGLFTKTVCKLLIYLMYKNVLTQKVYP